MKAKTLLIFAVAAVLSACNGGGNGVDTPVTMKLSEQQQEMLEVSNDFSFDLLREVVKTEEKDNIVLSPLSASMLLGMVMNGAEGETLREMQDVLGFESEYPMEDINEYYKQLIDALPKLDKTNTVKLANSIWAQEGFPFCDSFLKTNKDYFYAKTDNVDFQEPSKAIVPINKWAAQNTNNLIKEVIKEEDIDESTVMVLANALYFKGVWKEKFEKSSTRSLDFHLADGKTVKTDMMQQTEDFKYADVEGGKLLEMDYKEGKYCMDILLPNEGNNIRSMAGMLDATQWNQWMKALSTYPVVVRLPKVEVKYDVMLKDALKAMGMEEAFDRQTANFSKMSNYPLYMQVIKQFCYMKVDEEGTEAAAVTWGGMDAESAEPMRPKEFFAERPYLMVIREKQYGTILFTAVIGDPG